MRMFLWHKPLADCKHCSPEIVLPFPPRGGARVISFFLLLCNKKSGTISACRSKKAAQRFCWTASVPSSAHLYHTTSFRQNQHNFVHICPHLSTFVQVCPTCAQKHCTRKQISIASGSYPFCAAFFFMLFLGIRLDTDFMIFKFTRP